MSSYGLDALQVRLHDIDNEMNVMASILRSMNSMQTKRARNLIRGIDWDKDVIDNKKALQILDNLQGSDVFNFDQDVVELIKNIESSQAILDNYISALKRLV
ncbi:MULTISPECIES: hypothetical protein [Leuconostoc]|uniref:hypothetical protein n=1 Tax=Leuconostoc TaxID=1243 RepID=UPI0021A95A8A|nr:MULTISPECIES: hypothetical protein [Leuconostoc]MCT3039634.1 hypothetical protein [Leuconostoc mesenteroides]MCT3056226.1 hypothetical protein [Leuconostoc citreum]MCT3060167.1 hypothetical protein [Leuconostoc citreum]